VRPLGSANRMLAGLVAVALVPHVVFAFVWCALLTAVVGRVAVNGLGALSAGPGDLRPLLASGALVAAGGMAGVVSFRSQLRSTRRLVDRVRAQRAVGPPELEAAARRAGLHGRIDVVWEAGAFAFTYGFPRSRVALSQGLIDALDRDQLDAVLAHEAHHVRQRDPLKLVAARVASSASFFLPVLAGVRERYRAASELAADRRAMAVAGRGPLASALGRVIRGPAWPELETAAAVGEPQLLAARVEQLEGGGATTTVPIGRAALIATWVVAGVMVAALLTAAASVGGIDHLVAAAEGDDPWARLGWHDLWWAVPLAVVLRHRLRARAVGEVPS
jgi:Zn-dependent protease with chaperone function